MESVDKQTDSAEEVEKDLLELADISTDQQLEDTRKSKLKKLNQRNGRAKREKRI